MIDDKYIADLKETTEIEKSVKGLNEKQLNFRESEERWSIIQVLEHILNTEMAIAQLILSLEGEKAQKIEQVGYQKIAELVVNRNVTAKAPSFLIPSGKMKTTSPIIEKLKANRQMLVTKISMPGFEFGGETRKHMLLGDLGAIDWISFLTGHSARHCLQITEIKQHPDFPV